MAETMIAAPGDEGAQEGVSVGEPKKTRTRNRCGRPVGTGVLEVHVGFKAPRALLEEIDELLPSLPELSRSQVIRALIGLGLSVTKKKPEAIAAGLVGKRRS